MADPGTLFKPSAGIVGLLTLLAISAMSIGDAFSVRARPGSITRVPELWRVPVEVANAPDPTQTDYYDFAWRTFIAINWPCVDSGERGQPHTGLGLGQTDADGSPLPVVWMGYKDPDEVFLPRGADPPDWNTVPPPPPPSCTSVRGAPVSTLRWFNMASATARATPLGTNSYSALNQAAFFENGQPHGPLVDQLSKYVLYEVRFNRSEFTYITTQKYYKAGVQQMAVDNNSFVRPPETGTEPYFSPALPDWAKHGAIEIKAAWRILDLSNKVDDPRRYFTTSAFFVHPDGSCTGPHAIGLVGFHILRVTPQTRRLWFYATWEHIDNLAIRKGPSNKPTLRPNGEDLTPSFSPGGSPSPNFRNGYSYEPRRVMLGQKLKPLAPVAVSRVTPISVGAQQANDKWYSVRKGTAWEFYELIEVQNPFTRTGSKADCFIIPDQTNIPNTCANANSVIETYTQRLSCAECHYQGSPIGDSTSAPKYQIFSFILRHADKGSRRDPP